MYLLTPIYQYVYEHYGNSFNHFPLIRLIFYSLDKTIIYFLIFAVLRGLYLRVKKRRFNWQHELLLGLFVFYVLLLLALTVFRGIYFPWQIKLYLHRSLSEINLTPFVETLKLQNGLSNLDFIYNLYGNIAWFVPFGFLLPLLRRKRGFLITVFSGAVLSLMIETIQFFIGTGVTDIDDLIFNTTGALLGYLLFWLCCHRKYSHH
ncbi:VanZ family protein [Lapidilactobacillus bayanensis]|uniref:VanZ family protein n=1 Tax=Lapidilactobacillus bayanensis TaxID=2485998 RepID=UPI000F79412A|nr:VanZ family protein [Lapidilactobacillus bayanensis]